jgi:co-chaperonin GroES (HSP10)
MTTLRMQTSRVLIRPEKLPEKAGIIIIPAAHRKPQDNYHFGTVIAMGPGMSMWKGGYWPMPDGRMAGDVKMPNVIGKKVLYVPNASTMVVIDDIPHVVVNDTALHAYFDDDEAAE